MQKATDTTTTGYYLDGDDVILETTNGSLSARNIRGINQLARQDSIGTTMYYMYNGHGDVIHLVDSMGTIKNTYDYDIYGKEKTASAGELTNPMRYSGEYYDNESGMYYLRARYYDPEIARFISEDSYEGNNQDPLSLNLYTYCANNPIMLSDPSGNYYIIKNNDGTYRLDRDDRVSLTLKSAVSYVPWFGGYINAYFEKAMFSVDGGNSATGADGLIKGTARDIVGEAPKAVGKIVSGANYVLNTVGIAQSFTNYDFDVVSFDLMNRANISTSSTSIVALEGRMTKSYDFIKANYAYFTTTLGYSNLSLYQMDENIAKSNSSGKLIDKYTNGYISFLISQGVKGAKSQGKMFWYYLNDWSERRESVIDSFSSSMN